MKKIIYILVLSLFIFNCSKSDSDSDNSTETFLDLYGGSAWLRYKYAENLTEILRINDNLNKPIEVWKEDDYTFCYHYEDNGGDVTITENTKDKLVIKIVYRPDDVSTLTYIMVNGELLVRHESITDMISIEFEYTFQKFAENVDNLTICP